MNKEFLDGPKLARWIKENRPGYKEEMGESFDRALYRWEHENSQPNYYEVDHHLVKLNIFDWELPDDMWVHKRRNKVTKPRARIRAEGYFEEGYHLTEVRAMMKEDQVPYRTMLRWREQWRESNK